ncbi:hypothetical protein DYB32_008856 [Aphanomyces invadans]|nr:hypothetical protein DYB32_008856 [Aphanomyces invadans]
MKSTFALTVVAEAVLATLDETSVLLPSVVGLPPFCTFTSYPRGVGTVPKSCAPGQERIGVFCYDDCPDGMSRNHLDCHSNCPQREGQVFEDHGLFCRLSEYSRGAGYPWRANDGLSFNGAMERCEAKHGKDKCEKYGLMVYPKCADRYSAFGCCLCRPNPPDCEELGLGKNFDLSCAKKIVIGKPELGVCASDEELDTGLCYEKCKEGFYGVGPVCWTSIPSGWASCVTFAAKSSSDCAEWTDIPGGYPTCDQVTALMLRTLEN